MRNVFLVFFLFISFHVSSQRMDDSTLVWTYAWYIWGEVVGYKDYQVQNSTTINGLKYWVANDPKYPFRQDSLLRIYIWDRDSQQEYLIMDTSKNVGDTFYIPYRNRKYAITHKNYSKSNGQLEMTLMSFSGFPRLYTFGLGFVNSNPILYFNDDGVSDGGERLICLHKNGTKVYEASGTSRCQVIYTAYLGSNDMNRIWKYQVSKSDFKVDSQFIYRRFSKDTAIRNKTVYYKVYESIDSNFSSKKVIGLIRNQGYQIYSYFESKKRELLVYDLNVQYGDTIYDCFGFPYFVTSCIENHVPYYTYRTIYLNNQNTIYQDVGSLDLFSFMELASNSIDHQERLICVKNNQEIWYENPLYRYCNNIYEDSIKKESTDLFSITQGDGFIEVKNRIQYSFELNIYNSIGKNIFTEFSDYGSIHINSNLLSKGIYYFEMGYYMGDKMMKRIYKE